MTFLINTRSPWCTIVKTFFFFLSKTKIYAPRPFMSIYHNIHRYIDTFIQRNKHQSQDPVYRFEHDFSPPPPVWERPLHYNRLVPLHDLTSNFVSDHELLKDIQYAYVSFVLNFEIKILMMTDVPTDSFCWYRVFVLWNWFVNQKTCLPSFKNRLLLRLLGLVKCTSEYSECLWFHECTNRDSTNAFYRL